ncbi:MAG: TylF/MycF family methyltransferase [Candidatus Brocadiaceae bacterium]|nr:TylF/MycF family methyltransferase [Candidatus Brocadiaceae bacterium]
MTEKFKRTDTVYLAKRKELSKDLNIPDLWQIVDHFGLYTGIQTLGTRLAVFEIMKQCLNIPGHIAEFGCWNGNNLIYMAKVLQLLQPNTHKHIYGFDSFEGLQTFSSEDGESRELFGKYKGNEEQLRTVIDFFEMDEWVHLVKGNALDTIPKFEKDNPHLMFSMAYIDFDLYDPCKIALEYVGKRIAPGGVIVFDEALTNLWPGEGRVLVEFLSENGAGEYSMHNVTFARQPTVYLIKK